MEQNSTDLNRKSSRIENQRFIHADALISGRDKKILFDKPQIDPIWDPFGSPGNGAPLRNQNNVLVTKLPELNQNIWERFAPKSSNLITNKENQYQTSTKPEVLPKLEEKKKEINSIIDTYSKPENNSNAAIRNSSFSNYKEQKDQSYWNDWFGRPGNGAPRWNYNKQNLSEMLEPRNPLFQNPRPRNFNSSIDMYTSYNPTSLSGNMSPRRFRSDHHNHYELNPR